jgi:DNA-binding transcriptional MerR regulator
MRSLKTREAAGLLNVSPNTLRTWERKFGFPKPLRSAGRHRAYTYAEIVALRDALKRGLSVTSAISSVREGLGADEEALVGALDSFDPDGADRAMDASLALRSMELTVGDVLLPALDEVRGQHGLASATWALAHRWGTDWLRRAQRLAPPPAEDGGVLIADASGTERSSIHPHICALELFCRRSGFGVLATPVEALAGLPAAVEAVRPSCVVVAGGHASDEQIGHWAYTVRRLAGSVPTALYLRPMRSVGRDRAPHVLSGEPIEAHRQLVLLIADEPKQAASELSANRFANPR